jgi:biopolymer transport protein ExbD
MPRRPSRSPRQLQPASAGEPMGAMNITPLIDVLLVLLVMLILTIPAITHKLPIDLPGPGARSGRPPVVHQLTLGRDGALAWDGAALAPAALPGRLAMVRADADGLLQLRADPEARYGAFDHLLAAVKRAGITRLDLVGNAAYRRFETL